MSQSARTAVLAWLLAAVYYFYQYVLRSAPAVMMPQMSEAFGLSALGVASMVGVFYYGYSPFSLIAGAAIDRLGPRKVSRLVRRRSASGPCCLPWEIKRRQLQGGSCKARAVFSPWWEPFPSPAQISLPPVPPL